ncbi:type III pantothenate kinase [Roseibacillus persicicus]|uniref:Type III pantothenate kinase n=1 Tax=Roseibacillus persicicus TaxID=454148 RepID=A0A918TUB0_9BACT|nr:type III pantothenate kinase [Roseibacillus persicicus]GHC63824.1 type III pantothenate kinase [Roseibacillus persicicus]
MHQKRPGNRPLFLCPLPTFPYFLSIHLLIDNSNTRTKFAVADDDRILDWRAVIPTAELSRETIVAALPEFILEQATICSVVPLKAELLEATLNELGIATHVVSYQSRLPISIDYPKPAQIGPDRLANAAALAPLQQSAIVIDFGTAVTFDVVSATHGGTYLGGVIAPGLGALRDDLHQRTALLPRIDLNEPPSAIGKSTEHAMQVGAVIGYRGLIREILKALTTELPETPQIHATGGDAALIASKMPEITQVNAHLTLEGILKIGLLNA